jgi:hypothetical protein
VIRFILPAFALVGTVYFVCFTEEDWKWKLLMFLLTGTSFVLQFVFEVHFLIPLLIQAVPMFWTIIYWKLDR